MAAQIPDATMIELEGDDHFVSGNPDQILDAFEPFITGTRMPPPHTALAAVVHAGGLAAEDVTHVLVEVGGRRRQAAGGEVVVLFDGPATGVRAARTALRAAPDAGVGLSIAEVAVDGDSVSGWGVDEAVRLGAGAAPGELLVSQTAGVLLGATDVELTASDSFGGGALRVHAFPT